MCGNPPARQLLQKQFKAHGVQWGRCEKFKPLEHVVEAVVVLDQEMECNRDQGPGKTFKGLPLITYLF